MASLARVDLNCDLGEGYGDDEALFAVVSSANIACGAHAGDRESMARACASAVRHGVAIGAHPSYPDREGFGRREMDLPPRTLLDSLTAQIEALLDAAESAGGAVRYLKPHGALYNRIVHDSEQATVVAEAAARFGLPVLGIAGGAIERTATDAGLAFFAEAFADRGYRDDGTLAPRGTSGSVLEAPDAIAARVVRMAAEGTVETVDGHTIGLRIDSVCVHGDTPNAALIAARVRTALEAAGIVVEAFE